MSTQSDHEIDVLHGLEPKQQRFVHLFTTGQYSNAKLAQLLEVHPNTISKWLKRVDIQDAIADIQDTTHSLVSNDLKNLTLKATSRLRELMDSPIDGVALAAVKDVLDRSGHKPKNEIKIDKTVTTIEEKFKSLIDSTVLDAEFEEVDDIVEEVRSDFSEDSVILIQADQKTE